MESEPSSVAPEPHAKMPWSWSRERPALSVADRPKRRSHRDTRSRNRCILSINTYIRHVEWRIDAMMKARLEKPENKHERADRIAREFIDAERVARDKKTARLREMRLKVERMAA
jgi:hypothetical protein